jgi:hypothetical protein
MTTTTTARAVAYGAVTIRSARTAAFPKGRPECHAPSGFSVKDYSGAPAKGKDYSPRDVQRDTILAFWESQGVARWVNGGAGGGGRWMVRDMVNGGGEWLPLASQGEARRAGVGEFSHVVSTRNGGAWCACNLLPESGATNAARGDANITELSPGARAVLAAWPAWWSANKARPASLARLRR